MKLVLERIKQHGRNFKVRNYELGLCQEPLFGHIFDGGGVRMNPEKISGIVKAENMTNRTELRSILVIDGLYRHLIWNFTNISATFHASS